MLRLRSCASSMMMRVVGGEPAVALRLREQDAVGHQLHVRLGPRVVGEAHLVADQRADLGAQLLRDPRRDGARGDPARLRVADHAALAAPHGEADLGDLRGLARARLAADDDDLVVADGRGDLVGALRDGQLRRIVDDRTPRGTLAAPLDRARDGGGDALPFRRRRLRAPRALDPARELRGVGGHALRAVGEETGGRRERSHGDGVVVGGRALRERRGSAAGDAPANRRMRTTGAHSTLALPRSGPRRYDRRHRPPPPRSHCAAASSSAARVTGASMRERRHTAPTRRGAALLLAFTFALAVAAPGTGAATLRWAGRGDMQTTDPHSQNEGLTNNLNVLVYETLVTRDKKLGLVPALAVSWSQQDPTTWRFKLRPGVRFHDGTPFTADDVVFSFERARADTSQLRVYANAAGIPRKIDALTVEFSTPGPNPIELEHVVNINVMSRAWCEKNNALKPQNYTQKEDMITARAANGTGPYVLKSREPDVRTVLVRNPEWWGIRDGRAEGNVDQVIYLPIVSDATRVAALVSGEVDIVNDPPPQDVPRLKRSPGISVLEGAENRIVFIGMDQQRDELLYSSVKGKNPFKDRRVRQALYQAIDIEAIRSTIMRGLAQPSGAMLPSPVQSTPELERRLPYDKAKARQLLAEAGYPNGFDVTLDCPNNRYVNDEKICQALAAMWAQVGVKVAVNAMPRANYFPKLEKLDTSLYMLGWGGGATDAIFTLQPVLATHTAKATATTTTAATRTRSRTS